MHTNQYNAIFYFHYKGLFSYDTIFQMTRTMADLCKSVTIILLLILSSSEILAQKDQIPLEPLLEQASQRQLLKIGMIKESKPAKLKFGTFSTDNNLGKSQSNEDDKGELSFSFDLKDGTGNSARIEASKNENMSKASKENETLDDTSVYITTNLDPDDLWVLLISKSSDSKDISLANIFLTNGEEEITFKTVVGIPTNKSENTAPKGIEAFLDDYPIGAMQYYSGGSFSYKKFVWINEKSTPQIQLVMASVFSTMLYQGDYFQDSGFTE